MSSGATILDLDEYRARRVREARERTAPTPAQYVAAAPMQLVWPYGCVWAPCVVWLQAWPAM